MSELKPGWRRVPFGEFAELVTDRVHDPSQAGVDRYVGLEHLDSDSLRIRRWGTPDQVESTKLRFRPGDIIFGKRRAYQRKLGVADFEGICSAHAMVLRARPPFVVPEFLPLFMQSDVFMERAVSISVGSLSPTINWKTLASEEFTLPPQDEQRQLVELLHAAHNLKERLDEAVSGLHSVQAAWLERHFNEVTSGSCSVLDFATPMSGGTPARDRLENWNGSVPWLSPKDMKSDVVSDTSEHITELASRSVSIAPPCTTFVVVRGMILQHSFPVCYSTVPMAFNQDIKGFVANREVLPEYLSWWFRWAGPRFLRLISSTTHGTKRLESVHFTRVPFSTASPDAQAEFVAAMELLRGGHNRLITRSANARGIIRQSLKTLES